MGAARESNGARLTKRLGAGALLGSMLLVAGCGGGGGDAGTSPPPPPPPPPPTVEFDIHEITVMSGQSFSTTFGGTADGGLGPTVSLACNNGVVLETNGGLVKFTVPAASDVAHATCTAQVTDSRGRTATASIAITILPMTDIGQVVGIFNPALKLVLPNFNMPGSFDSYGNHVITLADASDHSGRFEVKAIQGSHQLPFQYDRDDIVRVNGTYASVDYVQSPSLFAHGLPDASMSIVSTTENKIYWLAEEPQSRVFSVREHIDVQSPCFIAQTQTYWANDMVVGQRDHGLTVFDVDTGSDVMDSQTFAATPVYSVGEGRSLCHIYRGLIPASLEAQFPGFRWSPPSGPGWSFPLTAIDYKTNELVFYGDIDGDNKLDEMGTMPLETHSTAHLNIVQVISRGEPTLVPQYLLVLLSDGRPVGEHRVVQINFDPQTREISQRIVHEWSDGVPVAMLQGPLGGSMDRGVFQADLVVVLGTTAQSFFFDDLLTPDDQLSEPPVYGEPRLFNVGVGAGSAVAAENPWTAGSADGTGFGVLVSYPASGRVVYISLPPSN